MFPRKPSYTRTNTPSFSLSTYLIMVNALFLMNKVLGFNTGSKNQRSIYFFNEDRNNDYKFTTTDTNFYQIIQAIQQGLCGADNNIKNSEQSLNYIELSSWETGAKLYRGTGEESNRTFENCLTNNINHFNNDLEEQKQNFYTDMFTIIGSVGGGIVLLFIMMFAIRELANHCKNKATPVSTELPSDEQESLSDDQQVSLEEVSSLSIS